MDTDFSSYRLLEDLGWDLEFFLSNPETYPRHKAYALVVQQDWEKHFIGECTFKFLSSEKKRIAESKLRLLCNLYVVLIHVDRIQGLFYDLKEHEKQFEKYERQLKHLTNQYDIEVNPYLNWFPSSCLAYTIALNIRRMMSGSVSFFRDFLFFSERTDKNLGISRSFLLAFLERAPVINSFSNPLRYLDCSIVNFRFILECFLVLKVSFLESYYFYEKRKNQEETQFYFFKASLMRQMTDRRFLMMNYFLSTMSNAFSILCFLRYVELWPYGFFCSTLFKLLQLGVSFQQHMKERDDLIKEIKKYDAIDPQALNEYDHARKSILNQKCIEKDAEFRLVFIFSFAIFISAMLSACATLPKAWVPVATSMILGMIGMSLFIFSSFVYSCYQYQFESNKKQDEIQQHRVEWLARLNDFNQAKDENEKKSLFLQLMSLVKSDHVVKKEVYFLTQKIAFQILRDTLLPFLMMVGFLFLPVGAAWGIFSGLLVFQALGMLYLRYAEPKDVSELYLNEASYNAFCEAANYECAEAQLSLCMK